MLNKYYKNLLFDDVELERTGRLILHMHMLSAAFCFHKKEKIKAKAKANRQSSPPSVLDSKSNHLFLN